MNSDDLVAQATDTAQTALALAITTPSSKTEAGELLRAIKQLIKASDDQIGHVVKQAHESHKAAKALLKSVQDPLKTAEAHLKQCIADYTAEEVRVGESERVVREEQAAKHHASLVGAGLIETPAPAVFAAPPKKLDGVSVSERQNAVVTNLSAFLTAIASNSVWHEAVKVDLTKLTKLVKVRGPVDGVEMQIKRVVSARS